MDDVLRVIEAIAASIRPAYGPFGKDRLVVTETQKLVTNSATRILEQVRPGSPLAKLILAHVRRVAASLGDGTATLALLLEGLWRFLATSLGDGQVSRPDLLLCLTHIENCLIPEEIAPMMQRLQCPLTQSEEIVLGLSHAFCGANFPPNVSQQLSKVFWGWLIANADCRSDCNSTSARATATQADRKRSLGLAAQNLQHYDLIKIPVLPVAGSQTSAGGGMSSSSVEHTHIVTGVLGHPGMPSTVKGGRVVVLDETVAPLPVEVTAPEAMRSHLGDLLVVAVQRLWQSGVRVALCASEVHEEWRGALMQRGILLLHLVESSELQLFERGRASLRIRLTTDDVSVIMKNALPLSSMRSLEQRGASSLSSGRSIWALSPAAPELPPHCWLLLRAPSVGLAAEYKHALNRLLRVVTPLLNETGCPIYGGLAFELAVARLAQARAAGKLPGDAEDAAIARMGVTDSARALRLHRLSWQMIAASLLNVLEVFLDNLHMSRAPRTHGLSGYIVEKLQPTASLWPSQCASAAKSTAESGLSPQSFRGRGQQSISSAQHSSPKSGRLARWLLVTAPEVLRKEGEAIGLQELPQGGLFGLNLCPGIGAARPGDAPLLLEMDVMKLGLLKALCGLSRQLVRLDAECLHWGGPSSTRGMRVPRKARDTVSDSSDSSSGSE